MCIGEILWRVKRLLWQTSARLLRKWWELQLRKSSPNPAGLVEMLDNVDFYGLPAIQRNDIPHKWIDNIIAAAEKLLQHRYNYLALGEIHMGGDINWNHEYKRGIDTPLLFGPWMDHRDSKSYGDFKYFWELPRLQHLITLAKAYYLTNEERYAGEVAKQIAGFVEQSPCLLGVNWIMPMEAAIRLVSICWVTVFLKERLKNDPRTCELIEYIVKSHVHYVASNYAAYSSANNHLVAEAAGVFMASTCFNQLDKMSSYRQEAYDILSGEIIHQHYPDGVNKEQAVHYQIFAFQFFLLAGLLAKADNIDFPDQYWDMLEKSANFIAAVADDDFGLPNIGDSDDGKAVQLSETDCNTVQSILATSAVLFRRSDFKWKARTFDETSFWLLGKEGKREFDALESQPDFAASKFEYGGYYVLTSDNGSKVKVIFDCGQLGLEPLAAHGHTDSLSFILSAHGRQYFIDPGTYTYVANDPYRNYFRSTQAHNTIVVDEKSQSQMTGPFLWGERAKASVQEWVTNEHYDKVVGWHDGYRRLQDPVTHRRTITLDKRQEAITVDDDLEMKNSHQVELYLHLDPNCRAEKINSHTWEIENTGKKIELAVDPKLNCNVYSGTENPIVGWFSGGYDQKCPTLTIVCHGTFSGSQHFGTQIRLAL